MRVEEMVERLWPGSEAVVTVLGGGITNHNFKVEVGGETFVLRIGGKDTELLGINRTHEHAASVLAASLGVGPEVVAFVEPEGYLVTRFVEGTPVPPERMPIAAVAATRKVRVGDPAEDTTEMGPLISAAHRELVASFVDGEPLFRGDAPNGKGFWFPCTLVEATPGDRIAREEVFGPVAAIIPFEDEEEAVRIANDSPYGLSGSIWTRDGARALRMARAIESGVLSVNSNSSVRAHTPFGGMKQSGFGRELGMHAMDGYSEVKNVFISTEA
jgi:hypothetical protein